MEIIDLVPIWSHARWYLDVKQSKAQWAKCLPRQGVALFISAQSYVRLALKNDALASAADANGLDRLEHHGGYQLARCGKTSEVEIQRAAPAPWSCPLCGSNIASVMRLLPPKPAWTPVFSTTIAEAQQYKLNLP